MFIYDIVELYVVLLEAYIMTMCFSLQESNRRTEVGSEVSVRGFQMTANRERKLIVRR